MRFAFCQRVTAYGAGRAFEQAERSEQRLCEQAWFVGDHAPVDALLFKPGQQQIQIGEQACFTAETRRIQLHDTVAAARVVVRGRQEMRHAAVRGYRLIPVPGPFHRVVQEPSAACRVRSMRRPCPALCRAGFRPDQTGPQRVLPVPTSGASVSRSAAGARKCAK